MKIAWSKTGVLIVPVLVVHILAAGWSSAGEFSDYTTEDVLTQVMETYARVQSAAGRIVKTFEAGDTKNTVNGRFAAARPGRLYLEYTGEDRQITVNDGETLYTYSPDQNRGLFKRTSELNPLETFVMGPEPLFGNMFRLLDDTFDIELADMVSGNLIMKATPHRALQVNFILVAVDPETWTIRAVENFDRNNTLISQTKYLEFRSVGDSLYFPSKTSTSTIMGDDILLETLKFSRIQLNVDFNGEWFVKPGDGDTEWISMDAVGGNAKIK